MNTSGHFLVVRLDEQRFALPVAAVERVLRAAAVTPLPHASQQLLGVLSVHGRLLPVVDLRRRCGLPPRAIDVDDQFVLVHTAERTLILPVDSTEVIQCAAEALVSADRIAPGLSYLHGVAKDKQGLIPLYDLEVLLGEEEDAMLAAAAGGEGGAA
jgi:purine-binding chemotaxis protein CheW